MRRLLPWVLFVAAAAVVLAYVLQRDLGGVGAPAPAERHEPAPGDPPVVWVAGSVESAGAEEIVLRDGRGPRVRLQRLAAGATALLRRTGDGWGELPPDAPLEPGADVCVEALLDDGSLVAIRLFLDAEGCGPV